MRLISNYLIYKMIRKTKLLHKKSKRVFSKDKVKSLQPKNTMKHNIKKYLSQKYGKSRIHDKHKIHNKHKIHKLKKYSKYSKYFKYSKNKNQSRNKYYQRHKLLSQLSNNYISKLVNLYYDNDNASNSFIKSNNLKQHIFPEQRRVIVIGDIHGDFDVAIKCLIIAKCINNIKVPYNKSILSMDAFFKQLEWIGNDTYIVQLGDQIDRVRPQNWDNNDITIDSAYKDEGSTLEIFYLFYLIDKLARKKGGRAFSIIGNHEIMNVEGDFRYVSLKEFKSFKERLETVYHKNSKYPYHSRTLKNNSYKLKNDENNMNSNNMNSVNSVKYSKLPDGFRERLYAFSPTGICSNMMGTNNYIILQIGKWLFCHGSPVLNTLNTYNIDSINNYVSMYLLGINNNEKNIDKHYHTITQHGKKSILWNRAFGDTEINNKKDNILSIELDTILEAYNNKNRKEQENAYENSITKNNRDKINRDEINNNIRVNFIAVGHTIQDTDKNGINSICDGRVWRCDVGMSKAFINKKNSKEINYYQRPQVLEILNGINTSVLF